MAVYREGRIKYTLIGARGYTYKRANQFDAHIYTLTNNLCFIVKAL